MEIKEQVNLRKLYHFLNLDYPQNGTTLELQTNSFISNIMEKFLNQYENDFKNKYVVLESQNDTLTLLAYTILKNIQVVSPFQLLILGKKYWLKKHTRKKKIKERYITNHQFSKLCDNDKVIFVNCYNPIYKVINSKNKFKKNEHSFWLLKNFTFEEIRMANLFYNITPTKKDKKWWKSEVIKHWDNFCSGFLTRFYDFSIETYNKDYPIYIVKFYNDMEKDSEILDEIINTHGMIFYHCARDEKDYPILSSNFQFYLKNKSNIPNKKYFNINAFEVLQGLYIENGVLQKPIFLGDFTKEEKSRWLPWRFV